MSQLLYPVNLNETLTDIAQFRKYKKVKMSLKVHLYILCSCQGSFVMLMRPGVKAYDTKLPNM